MRAPAPRALPSTELEVRVPAHSGVRWVAALVEGRPVALTPVREAAVVALVLPLPLLASGRFEVRGAGAPAGVLRADALQLQFSHEVLHSSA